MPRNFYRRIEVVFPVLDPRLRQRLAEAVLPAFLRDNIFATELHANGAYVPVPGHGDEPPFSVQEYFLAQAAANTAEEAALAKIEMEKPKLRTQP